MTVVKFEDELTPATAAGTWHGMIGLSQYVYLDGHRFSSLGGCKAVLYEYCTTVL